MTEFRFDIAPAVRGRFDDSLFKRDVDEAEFRKYARENDAPESWESAEIMHPYCRDEWFKLGKFAGKGFPVMYVNGLGEKETGVYLARHEDYVEPVNEVTNATIGTFFVLDNEFAFGEPEA